MPLSPSPNTSPLYDAVKCGNVVEVQRILTASEAKVDERYENGITTLMSASFRGNTEVIQALLDAKADPDAQVTLLSTQIKVVNSHYFELNRTWMA